LRFCIAFLRPFNPEIGDSGCQHRSMLCWGLNPTEPSYAQGNKILPPRLPGDPAPKPNQGFPAVSHRLRLTLRMSASRHRCGVDPAQKAIGVILSGMGSDGTSGFREIKDVGDFTVVQEPSAVRFVSMPRSAHVVHG
jgi:chemotaxis response regulator CheB